MNGLKERFSERFTQSFSSLIPAALFPSLSSAASANQKPYEQPGCCRDEHGLARILARVVLGLVGDLAHVQILYVLNLVHDGSNPVGHVVSGRTSRLGYPLAVLLRRRREARARALSA